MISEKYSYMSEDPSGDMTSYEEQLLLNYDDYLEGGFVNPSNNHYNLELGGLEEDLEDDFESEYDENDWEEEDPDQSPVGEYDKNEEKPGAFLVN